MKSSLRNMVLTLLIVTFVASTSVGYVYQLTQEPIAQAKAEKTRLAIAKVVPAFNNNPAEDTLSRVVEGQQMLVYVAKNDTDTVGYAIETFSKEGFGGLIKLMVGFLPDGTIHQVAVLSHTETPGLGDKIDPKKSNFGVQFCGKNPETYRLFIKKDNGDVDAITASTITSRAYTDALRRAYTLFKSQTGKETCHE